MSSETIPPMEPLTPIVDRTRELAHNELPSPHSCRIRLWDDGTFDVRFYHSMGIDETQVIRYVRQTSEIVWEHVQDAHWETTSFSGGETLHEPANERIEVRVIERVEPPYE